MPNSAEMDREITLKEFSKICVKSRCRVRSRLSEKKQNYEFFESVLP